MTVAELIKELSLYRGDADVFVSVDVSTEDANAEWRIFADVRETQCDRSNGCGILCDLEEFNYRGTRREVIQDCIKRVRHLPAAVGSLKKMLTEEPK